MGTRLPRFREAGNKKNSLTPVSLPKSGLPKSGLPKSGLPKSTGLPKSSGLPKSGLVKNQNGGRNRSAILPAPGFDLS